jgi:hypothetical protein
MTFEHISANEITTSASNQSLGVGAGLNQEKFNQELLSIIADLKDEISALRNGAGGTIISAEGLSTTAAEKIVYRPDIQANLRSAQYNTVLDPFGIKIEWDLTRFIESLPPDHVVRSVRVYADGGNKLAFDSKQKVGTATINLTSFPATLFIDVRTDSNSGSYTFSAGRALEVENKVSTIPLEYKALSGRRLNNQEELNTYLLERLNTIERKL